MQPVFFYGLFMDHELLESKGLKPLNPMIAEARNFGLRIGERATLVSATGERAYGIVMTLTANEISTLYSDPSVADYRPESLIVFDPDDRPLTVTSYNLPVDKFSGHNKAYALALADIATRLGLPPGYVDEIRRRSG